jgi:hypothetical protein
MTEERGGKAIETGRIDEAGGVVRLGQFQWKLFLCLPVILSTKQNGDVAA